MWSAGVFSEPIDGSIMLSVIALCLAVTWQRWRRLGPPRFRGARIAFWSVSALALPLPLYLGCGVGLWVGAILFESVGLRTAVGAALGWVLFPPILCFLALKLLAAVFTSRCVSVTEAQPPHPAAKG